jgi:hypothetical protein
MIGEKCRCAECKPRVPDTIESLRADLNALRAELASRDATIWELRKCTSMCRTTEYADKVRARLGKYANLTIVDMSKERPVVSIQRIIVDDPELPA